MLPIPGVTYMVYAALALGLIVRGYVRWARRMWRP